SCACQRAQLLAVRLPEWMEAVPVFDDAAHHPRRDGLAAEPQPWALRAEGLRLEVDVGEAAVPPLEAGGGARPQLSPGGEMLVEQGTAPLERHAQCLVLVAVPAPRGLQHEASLAHDV